MRVDFTAEQLQNPEDCLRQIAKLLHSALHDGATVSVVLNLDDFKIGERATQNYVVKILEFLTTSFDECTERESRTYSCAALCHIISCEHDDMLMPTSQGVDEIEKVLIQYLNSGKCGSEFPGFTFSAEEISMPQVDKAATVTLFSVLKYRKVANKLDTVGG